MHGDGANIHQFLNIQQHPAFVHYCKALSHPMPGCIPFLRLCHGPERRTDLEQSYLRDYWMRDESIPRIACMPEGRLVPTGDLYTELEKRTSPAYNEAWRDAEMQNGLNVRLRGPGGSHIVWNIADSVAPGGWDSSQIETIQRLLPHVHQVAGPCAAAARRSGVSRLDDDRAPRHPDAAGCAHHSRA